MASFTIDVSLCVLSIDVSDFNIDLNALNKTYILV